MIEWFDSHCHVDEEAFDGDREEVLARMRENGITRFAVIGSDMETSRRAAAFAAAHRGAVAAGGVHPHEAKGFREADLEELAALYRQGRIRAISSIPSPRAVRRMVPTLPLSPGLWSTTWGTDGRSVS